MNNGGKQTTLFQTWASAANENGSDAVADQPGGGRRGATVKEPIKKKRSVSKKTDKKLPIKQAISTITSRGSILDWPHSSSVVDLGHDDSDEELLLAMEESLRTARAENILTDDEVNSALSHTNYQHFSHKQIDPPSNGNIQFSTKRPKPLANSTNRPNRHSSSLHQFNDCNSKDTDIGKLSTVAAFNSHFRKEKNTNAFQSSNGNALNSDTNSRRVSNEAIAATENVEDLPGFDTDMGQIWIYPTNYPMRDYQFNIVQKVLFENTMVSRQ